MIKFIEKELGNGEMTLQNYYGDDYKERAFWKWYNNGKLSFARLTMLLQETENICPSKGTLTTWVNSWKERADELDQQIKDEFSAEVVQTKVEMLRRHADIGKELQEVGLGWIRENKDKLTAASVTRIIKDGYEMERASVGVPEALTKLLSVSDEELKKQIEEALTGDDVDILDANN